MPFAPIEDGELYFEEYGSGPPLLFVAGLGGMGGYWTPQIDEFARSYRVIIYDHRGCGKSTRSEIVYSVDNMTDDLLNLMDHLKIDRAHLVGHSTGGAIGQKIAVTKPERLNCLVLYATWTRSDAFMGRVMRARKALLESAGIDAYIGLTPALLYPNWWLNNNPDKLAALDRISRESFPSVSIAASRCQAVIDFDITAKLATIKAPTFIICARDDFLTPPYFSEELARQIAGAELKILQNGGHCVSQVDAEAFNSSVAGFLKAAT